MLRLQCSSTFKCYEPIDEFRQACPRRLVVCRRPHMHPIPLPTKTPPSIRNEVFDILQSLDVDLANITPRQLRRHTHTQAYFQKCLPNVLRPMLADLHVSLANREHVKWYIIQVQSHCFPFGTGWKGAHIVHNVIVSRINLPQVSSTSNFSKIKSSPLSSIIFGLCRSCYWTPCQYTTRMKLIHHT